MYKNSFTDAATYWLMLILSTDPGKVLHITDLRAPVHKTTKEIQYNVCRVARFYKRLCISVWSFRPQCSRHETIIFFLSLYIWVIFYRINKKGPGNEKIYLLCHLETVNRLQKYIFLCHYLLYGREQCH